MKGKLTERLIKTIVPQQTPYEVVDSEIKGFILRVHPSGILTYYLIYRTTNGAKKRYRLGRHGSINVTEARDLAKQFSAKALSGQDVREERKRAHLSLAERSRIMASVKSKGNRSTEVVMLVILKNFHLKGWRRHLPMVGRPDFCFPKYKIAIFVDGCFWHGCPKCFRAPKQNATFWIQKIKNNIKRDKKNTRLLRKQGWAVLRFWEHGLNNPEQVARRIFSKLPKKNVEKRVD